MPLARRAYLVSRAARGRGRPAPADIVVGNLMGVSTGAEHSGRIFARYMDTGADLYLLTECADLTLRAELSKLGRSGKYGVLQNGDRGSAASGTAIVYRRAHVKIRRRLTRTGSPQTGEGGGIRARPLVGAKVTIGQGRERWRVQVWAGHNPPRRAPRAARVFMRAFGRLRGLRGGDLNLRRKEIRDYVRRGEPLRSVEVLALVAPARVPLGAARPIPGRKLANADHPGVRVTAWPPSS